MMQCRAWQYKSVTAVLQLSLDRREFGSVKETRASETRYTPAHRLAQTLYWSRYVWPNVTSGPMSCLALCHVWSYVTPGSLSRLVPCHVWSYVTFGPSSYLALRYA